MVWVCMEELHRAAEIRDVPGEYVTEGDEGLDHYGVEEAVKQGLTTGKLFTELNVPLRCRSHDERW